MLEEIIRQGPLKDVVIKQHDTGRVFLRSKPTIEVAPEEFDIVSRKKAIMVTSVAKIIFRLLEENGIKTAFIDELSELHELRQKRCVMFPATFIVRRVAFGTYPIRNPYIEFGTEMSTPIVDIFFQTDNPSVGTGHFSVIPPHRRMPIQILHDDEGKIANIILHHPNYPNMAHHQCRMSINAFPKSRKTLEERLVEIETLAKKVFLILEIFFAQMNIRLTDVKVEVGYDIKGNLLVADIISLDSWRVFIDGKNYGK
ncbi:MAG TPA: phosphoribosylaminoimidazolesuccinocarboxamide synthase, partial [Candidatus Paceibacterota bacterium]|nr:phosphoribosylaminoimidazolesuccinocarboxamide synthase [Candidatus Paceibacterota bacterium]